MKPHYVDDSVRLFHGDCLDVLRELPDASVDAVCTDPPYGLGFMGQKWDTYANETGRAKSAGAKFDHIGGNHNPSNAADAARTRRVEATRYGEWCEQWAAECLRVLKPGGHMLAFGGTRTWHRLACAVEDAGFEVRDSIAWLYGSGFPKSLDVSKAIDKHFEPRPQVDLTLEYRFTEWARSTGVTSKQIDEATASNMGGHYLTAASQPAIPTRAMLESLRPLFGEIPAWVEGIVDQREREKAEARARQESARFLDTLQAKNAARKVEHGLAERWQGWGTALRPSFEPIVVGRKPLSGTVASNVLTHGTGAINVDACRTLSPTASPGAAGRWPANVLLDGSQADALDAQSGTLTSGANPTRRGSDKFRDAYGEFAGQTECVPARGADSGGASRFFPTFRYEAKAPTAERPRVKKEGAGQGRVIEGASGKVRECRQCGNRTIRSGETEPACGHGDFAFVPTATREEHIAHPTVKPLDLMRWLVRLVTPPGGTVLEPFAGSGTTAEACVLEGFQCIAIEREADYLPLIVQRLSKPLQAGLSLDFGDTA